MKSVGQINDASVFSQRSRRSSDLSDWILRSVSLNTSLLFFLVLHDIEIYLRTPDLARIVIKPIYFSSWVINKT